MSLQSSMAVMKAKLAGNEMQLKALAAQGDMEAAAALKEMLDAKQLKTDVQNQGAMQTPDQPSVLDQMTMPQSGLAAYAGGGRVRAFQAGGVPATKSPGFSWENDTDVTPWQRQGFARRAQEGDVGGRVTQRDVALAKNRFSNVYKEPDTTFDGLQRMLTRGYQTAQGLFSDPNYGNEGRPPTPVPADAPGGAANVDDRQKRNKANYSGIAAVAAPKATPAAGPSSGGPHNMMKPSAEAEALSAAPAPDVKDMETGQIADVLAQLEPLQKKRDALRDKSREQLEKLYNETVKVNTPGIWQKLAEMGSAMAAHGGSNAWAALGAGGKAAIDSEKDRQKTLLAAQAAYQKADMLEQEAQVRDQMGDVQGAYDLRQKAAALQKQVAAQKSTERLQGAQANYYEKMGDAALGKADAALTVAAKKGSGLGAAAGPKPMNQAQYVAAIQREAGARATADGKDMTKLSPQERDVYLRAAKPAVDALVAGQGKPAAASPAAPSSGFKILSVE